MRPRRARVVLLVILALFVGSSTAFADDLADARAFIAKQSMQIKKGDVAGLRAGFSKRLHDRITKDNLKKAHQEIGALSLEELVDSVTPGKDTLKITMKSGRTLTTLVKVDGKWLADTLWFK